MKIIISNFETNDKIIIEKTLKTVKENLPKEFMKATKGNLAMRFFSRFSPFKLGQLGEIIVDYFFDEKLNVYTLYLVLPYENLIKSPTFNEIRKEFQKINPQIKLELTE